VCSARRRRRHAVTAGPQSTFVVEYSCDRFCCIEVDLSGERGQLTLREMREKADGLHQGVHEPDLAERDASVVAQEAPGRPAATVFLAAPGRAGDRRR
jgi:hypothetical protein